MSGGPISEELFDQGMAALGDAEFDDAIELLEQAAVEDPTNARAWFHLGVCYLETGKPDLALEAMDRAINADPALADAYYMRGTALGALGRIDEAAESYRSALKIEPGHQKAEEFLIRTEALLASREHFRTAARLIYSDPKPDDWISSAVRELLHSVAIFKDSPAKGDFRRLADRIRENGDVRVDSELGDGESPFWKRSVIHGQSAFDRGNWPEAASSYNEALDLSPDHAFIHHALGLIYFALGDAESGITAWQRTNDLDPEFDFSKITRVKN